MPKVIYLVVFFFFLYSVQILMHTNCVFELISTDQVQRHVLSEGSRSPYFDLEDPPPHLRLKGQMLPLAEHERVIFLCSPV